MCDAYNLPSLFKSAHFDALVYDSKEQWRQGRKQGLGGSDAAACLGKGFNSLRTVYYSKQPDVDEIVIPTDVMIYGTEAEPYLRALYGLKHPEMNVQYYRDTILRNRQYPWRLYSPDGLLQNDIDGRRGLLEIKTYWYRSKTQYEADWGREWPEEAKRMPDKYLCQVLHGLLCTGYDFVVLCAEIIYPDKGSRIIERRFDREEVEDQLALLDAAEQEAWTKYFEPGIEPPVEIKL